MVSQILIVMIAAIIVTLIAERRGIQAPLLLALVGLAASFIPGLDRLELEPEIILTVVLPPLLFSAATEFSFVSFLKRFGSIVNLGVILVLVTAAVTAGVAAAVVPGMTIAVALVLGAVVAPPDAVTASAIGRKLGLPGRMMTVLRGESLINDAAALTLFTFATATVAGTQLFISNVVLYFIYSALAGVLIGVVLGAIVHRARTRLDNATLATVLTVIVPFTAFILAEELGASGVLAVVAAGFSLGHTASGSNYAARIQERQFWRTADGLLEAFVFAYIGLQLRFVIEEAVESGYEIAELVGLALVILVAVMAIRIGWVFVSGAIDRWRYPRILARIASAPANHPARRMTIAPPFGWRENLVISWAGMRGVVTLAAAAGIPLATAAGTEFPGRDVIQAIAFVVTIGTLLLQGLTLPWLIRVLGISDPHEEVVKAEQTALAEKLAQEATVTLVSEWRDRQTDPAARQIVDKMLARVRAIDAAGSSEAAEERPPALMIELSREILKARRAAIVKARDERRLDDEVMREMLEQMDLEQAVMANWTPEGLGR